LAEHYLISGLGHHDSQAWQCALQQSGAAIPLAPGFDEVSQLYIDPIDCIDCGACVPVCPVSAIFALDDLPEKWKHYAEMNDSYVKGGKFTTRRVC
jgi:ferredoxin